MRRLWSMRQSQRWVLVGVGVVALSAWGIYVWKFTGRSSRPAETPPEPVAGPVATGDARPTGTLAAGEAGGSLTALRATRTTGRPRVSRPADLRAPSAGSGEPGPAVRANAPVSLNDLAGIRIGPADRAAEDAGPAAATPWPGEPPVTTPRAGDGLGAVDSDEDAAAALAAARSARTRGDLIAARAAYSRALGGGLAGAEALAARGALADLAEALLFSRATNPDDPLTFSHEVGDGELLHVIARRNRISAALLASINRLSNPDRLRAGARLKVIRGPFDAVIWKSAHRLDVYLAGSYVRSFRVGLGVNGGTPLGRWVVKNKLKNPAWTDPTTGRYFSADDPENPIGERWIGMECVAGDCLGRSGFGIHGTIDPKSIGENLSMGCVRLVPEDVALVFDLLVERHSHIDIRP